MWLKNFITTKKLPAIVDLLNKGHSSSNVLLMVILFVVSTIFLSSLIPPFQSPDEQDHLKRAYLLSQGRISMITPEGQSTGGYIDESLSTYMGIFTVLPGKVDSKLTREMLDDAKSLHWSKTEVFNSCPGVNYYFPAIYLPQTIGLWIGQLLDLSIHHSYYLARTLASISILILLWMAFRTLTPSPLTLGLLLMPLMLFQSVATSQDGIAVAMLILCVSIFVKLMDMYAVWNKTLYITFVVTLLVLVNSRLNLMPMLLMPLVIAYRYRQNYLWWSAIAVVILAFIWVFYALMTTVDSRVSIGAKPSELLLHYIKHPIEYLSLVFDSISNSHLQHFYITSFVGVLGWLDASVGASVISSIYWILLILLFLSLAYTRAHLDWLPRATLLVVSLSSCLLVFFLLLITWTPHPAELISGVQGRYFWSSALLFSVATTRSIKSLPQILKIFSVLFLCVLAFISVTGTVGTVLDRYYLASQSQQGKVISINPKDYAEKNGQLVKIKDKDEGTPKGGFVDNAVIQDHQIVITGWGFFSGDSKIFYSNLQVSYPITYITIPRGDVRAALRNPKLSLSGFELRITIDDQDPVSIMRELCIYSEDAELGVHQLQAGNESMLYKCEK
ncbi:DUF2142 domain-containing protein [Cellvibrio japonicus]|uniref:Putative membrane protein n=1 Tax=Cellvibrio japonicus (strain Ueda107) TaxID=498211 RepID=B3PFZ9_CELJU|nr:DUF2142 domain-containing protein [Cellvibrio japonicus]ACE84215.1 putative membrane protein [Cellvibrio japonicus Ueda107]QEI13687.1 DUF2142 domain-containing protein [Cellvibrio japonicus]QEI17261.1 DUF2142 domain-containing protein [Cellvibrio japonicus]QEI20838.1 DUF2142 domain-containing protein [Cellvibrio japonicus]